ncbi:MAG TPA: hypothetical protein VFX91_07075 [Alcanivorax sp.]|nr:hypothetical protein [Alcanivorax sp.]
MKGTLKKSALLSFALAGVLAAPAAMAESTSEKIDREYKEAMQDEAMGDHNEDTAPNPDYAEERKNIDDPDRINKQYEEAMQEKRSAEGQADGMKKDGGDYLEKRKNMDDPDYIQKEYEKAMEKKQ